MESNIFNQIMETCPEKKVVSRCNKLSKKSKLTSGAVASTLTELGYCFMFTGILTRRSRYASFHT